jgi:hypothetical protein
MGDSQQKGITDVSGNQAFPPLTFMLPSWLKVAGVSLLFPMVRKKRLSRLKTS